MTERNKPTRAIVETHSSDIQRLQQRLDLLDRRLDNIDSMVSAVAERVMNRPLTINLRCPSCGRNIEVAVIGTEKPSL